MTLVAKVLRYLKQPLAQIAGPLALVALLLITGCGNASPTVEPSAETPKPAAVNSRPTIQRVDPPALIDELSPWLDQYQPQVQIYQPQADQVVDDTTVEVVLRVQDLPIYKDELQGMGPHLELLLDNRPYGSVYDIDHPILLEKLTPGTHTIRALAVRPWQESFKNEGSYAQVTFHVFAKTDENAPAVAQPLLTYGAPVGTYGAEPVLLDFYLTDAPLHEVAQDSPTISDWRIRYTINGDNLVLKDWESIYIEGLQPGRNWIQLTLVDDEGTPVEGVFNNTVRLIEYDPDLDDGLAKLVRGDVALAAVGGIVDPNYEPPQLDLSDPSLEPDPSDPSSDPSAGPSLEPDLSDPTIFQDSEPPISQDMEQGSQVDNALDMENPDMALESDMEAVSEPVSEPVLETVSETETMGDGPMAELSAKEAPIEEAFVEDASTEDASTEDALVEDASIEDAPIEDAPIEDTFVEEAPMEDASIEDAFEMSNMDEASSANLGFLRRLYDYRDRAMQSYEYDQN